MKSVYRFFDKLIFAFGVVIFLQFPNFMDQYTQRLGGYYEASHEQLIKYEKIATQFFEGDMEQLLEAFSKSDEKALHATGEEIKNLYQKDVVLKEGVEIMENENFIRRLIYLVFHPNWQLVRGTLRAYTPGMPFTTESLVCGLLGGVLISLIFNGFVRVFRWLFGRKKLVESDNEKK